MLRVVGVLLRKCYEGYYVFVACYESEVVLFLQSHQECDLQWLMRDIGLISNIVFQLINIKIDVPVL